MKLINHSKEKLCNAIVYFAKNTKHCGITKLMKLLYYLDFIHYRQTGKSVTGQQYSAWKMGPVPVDVYRELSEQADKGTGVCDAAVLVNRGEFFKEVVPKKKFNSLYFSDREMKILREVAEIFRDAQAEVMVEATHLKNSPWEKTKNDKGMLQEIDYDLALDGSSDQLDPEIIKERREEINEVRRLLLG